MARYCKETKKWNDNEYFIFDDTFDHQAWNYTKEKRIVLIIDIMRPVHIPKGTVKGGHTKELNDLLSMFN